MDQSTLSLDHILHSGEYVRVPNVVIFDEHDEHDKKGNVVRRFDREKLQKIADNCNEAERRTGTVALLGAGHTRDDVPNEEHQPAPVGIARNYRVGKFGPRGEKLGLLCDYYVKKQVRTNDGKIMDGVEYVKSFPRPSIELWPDTLTIDWIALLRRAPKRSLGLLTNARISYHRSGLEGTQEFRRGDRTVLRYSMENSTMPDAPNPVDAPKVEDDQELDAAPDGHEDFIKHLDYAAKNHPMFSKMCKKYAAEMPGPDNLGVPGAGGEDEQLLMNMRQHGGDGSGDVQVSRYERDIAALKAELAGQKHTEKMLRFEKTLTALRDNEGIELNVDEEKEFCETMDDAKFKAHVERIQKRYSRTPVGKEFPSDFVHGGKPKDNPLDNEENIARVMKYARDKGYVGSDAVYRAARELKIIE